MMVVVVPGEELLAKGTRVLDGAEALGELGHVLEGLELALRVRIVVRDVGPAMGQRVYCGRYWKAFRFVILICWTFSPREFAASVRDAM
jgi:hypothetical protein